MPTEIEWEYAARAGNAQSRYGELDAIAWYDGNSGKMTHPVGLKQANALGLYDMLGNVWEWTEDEYAGTSTKIVRGGAWNSGPRFARASTRGWISPTFRDNGVGFRCAEGLRNVPTQSASIENAADGSSARSLTRKATEGYPVPEEVFVEAYVRANAGLDDLDEVHLRELAHLEYRMGKTIDTQVLLLGGGIVNTRGKRAIDYLEKLHRPTIR
jgi:hypothetical protein